MSLVISWGQEKLTVPNVVTLAQNRRGVAHRGWPLSRRRDQRVERDRAGERRAPLGPQGRSVRALKRRLAQLSSAAQLKACSTQGVLSSAQLKQCLWLSC